MIYLTHNSDIFQMVLLTSVVLVGIALFYWACWRNVHHT